MAFPRADASPSAMNDPPNPPPSRSDEKKKRKRKRRGNGGVRVTGGKGSGLRADRDTPVAGRMGSLNGGTKAPRGEEALSSSKRKAKNGTNGGK